METRTIILNPKLINCEFEAPKLTLKILKLIVKWYSKQLILNEKDIYKTNNIYIKNSLIYIDIVILNDVVLIDYVKRSFIRFIEELISNPDNCGKYPITINDIEYKITGEIIITNKNYILNIDENDGGGWDYSETHIKSLPFTSFFKLKNYVKTYDMINTHMYGLVSFTIEECIIDSDENLYIFNYGDLTEYCRGNIDDTFHYIKIENYYKSSWD